MVIDNSRGYGRVKTKNFILMFLKKYIPSLFTLPDTPSKKSNSPDIDHFRGRLIFYLLLSLGIFGFIAWLPSIYYGLAYKFYSVIFIDTLALGWVFFLLAKRNLSFFRKTLGLLAVFYTLGLWLLIGLGPTGAGFMWLLLFSIMTGVLLGFRPALITFGLNLVTVSILTIFVSKQILTWQLIPSDELAIWTVKSINFICINAIVAVSTGFLITKISLMAQQEKQRRQTLGREVKARIRAEEENKALTQQLYQSQKMEAMGTLAGGISHDFNNILGIIKGYAELALSEPDLPESISRDLDHINHASERASGIISQIMAFSRHQPPDKIPEDMGDIARECIDLFRIGIPGNVSLTLDIPSVPVPILADRNQIYQVIMNLLTNGLHALDPDRDPGRITLSSQIDKNHIRLIVKDTGRGISKKNLPLIFDPYFTTKEAGKGTGMGLSISHGIVRAHGGEIRVESTPGQGSEFTVILPLNPDAGTPVPQKKADALARGSEHILMVDDEPDVLTVQTQLLSTRGYRVRACDKPSTALDLLRNAVHTFDLVITDQKMPEMTGHDLRARISVLRPDLPVILCSGFPDPGRDKLFAGVLAKPVTAAGLSGAVRRALDRGNLDR